MDLSSVKRGEWISATKNCHMNSCRIYNKDAVVQDGEKLRISLSWTSQEEIEELYLRILFRAGEENICSAFPDQPVVSHKGENTYDFEIDIENLPPGTYGTAFILYEMGKTGASIDRDDVLAVAFERSSASSIYNNWSPVSRGWCRMGSIHLVSGQEGDSGA